MIIKGLNIVSFTFNLVSVSFLLSFNSSLVLFDAVFVPAGKGILNLKNNGDVKEFLTDAYKHCKFIAAESHGIKILPFVNSTDLQKPNRDVGVLVSDQTGDKYLAASFIDAVAKHRFWEREANLK